MNPSIKKFFRAAIWLPTILTALGIGIAGMSKFANWALWSGLFEGWGYGAWFAAVIGTAEILGGIALFVPRLAAYAASGLIVIMLGAVYTTTTKPNELGWTTATVYLVLLALILAFRWSVRWRTGSAPQAD